MDTNTVSNGRINKSAFLADHEHEVIQTIATRTGDMTGLNMLFAESLQVANYGIGGFYETHYDFFSSLETRNNNDRIATVLYYVGKLKCLALCLLTNILFCDLDK